MVLNAFRGLGGGAAPRGGRAGRGQPTAAAGLPGGEDQWELVGREDTNEGEVGGLGIGGGDEGGELEGGVAMGGGDATSVLGEESVSMEGGGGGGGDPSGKRIAIPMQSDFAVGANVCLSPS